MGDSDHEMGFSFLRCDNSRERTTNFFKKEPKKEQKTTETKEMKDLHQSNFHSEERHKAQAIMAVQKILLTTGKLENDHSKKG